MKKRSKLALTRRVGEKIIISNREDPKDIFETLTVISIDGGQVRICIDADSDTLVDREEIYNRRIKEGWKS